jgi:ABC-type branched-subunit amino acid transport system ATPase component
MNDHNYLIQISSSTHGVAVPQINAYFGRITVLLGSNGTGKTRALQCLRSMSSSFGGENRPVVYIEGGRVIDIPPTIAFDYQTYSEFGTLQRAKQTFAGRRLSSLRQRTKDAFYLLERRSDALKITHSDAVTEWQRNGALGECPELEDDPLNRLFKMFSEIFPEIQLKLESENKQIICLKNGQSYSPAELSDGEKQILFILADIALSAEPNSLIIADEPELNLNPKLADRLWDAIENDLPDAVFVYSTHNISFAMRQSVIKLIALSGQGAPALQVDRVTDINPDEAREFLGAIPAILAAPAAVAVEGDDLSFDSGFFKWVLGYPEVAIVPLGGCSDVLAATTRRGIWEKLASSVKLAGVIDRDYRSNNFLLDTNKDSCIVLDYHESESYLCHPNIIYSVANVLGTVEHIPSQEEIHHKIFNYFNNVIIRVAVNRMAERTQIRLGVSLKYSSFKDLSEEELIQLIAEVADQEAKKADVHIGGTVAVKVFNEELQQCQKALQEKNIEDILRLAPGKELLPHLAPITGCKDSSALARAVYKHFTVESFEHLKTLRNKLKPLL